MSASISESEKRVMEVLWKESPLTSAEVVSRLADQKWKQRTVKTFLNRLVKKQVVTFEKVGRRYLYTPLVARDTFVDQESAGFLERVFKGDVKALLANFVKQQQLTEQEMADLKDLLDKQISEGKQ